MIIPTLYYAIGTILLSLVEAIRFKVQWGKVKNINHAVSRGLGIAVGALILIWWGIAVLLCNWWSLLAVGITALSFVGIRFALYDPFLNIFRLLFGINPTGRIDYVSTQTSSYEDQHSEKVTFWWKRVIGGAGWAAMYFLYKIIFKV